VIESTAACILSFPKSFPLHASSPSTHAPAIAVPLRRPCIPRSSDATNRKNARASHPSVLQVLRRRARPPPLLLGRARLAGICTGGGCRGGQLRLNVLRHREMTLNGGYRLPDQLLEIGILRRPLCLLQESEHGLVDGDFAID